MSEPEELTISELIIYKNNQLIAFNKPSAIAVQKDKTEDKSLIDLAEIYCKSTLELVHRIDRPASGVVLFAKSKKALAHLNEQFRNRSIEKTYLAVVGNRPTNDEGELTHYLWKDGKRNQSYIQNEEKKNAKKAISKYKYIASSERYHLLEVQLITGRHHQIRAQLGAINCPIKGDVKYGFRRGNRDRSIHLHCWKMAFQHPVSKKKVELVATPPSDPVWDVFDI